MDKCFFCHYQLKGKKEQMMPSLNTILHCSLKFCYCCRNHKDLSLFTRPFSVVCAIWDLIPTSVHTADFQVAVFELSCLGFTMLSPIQCSFLAVLSLFLGGFKFSFLVQYFVCVVIPVAACRDLFAMTVIGGSADCSRLFLILHKVASF